MRILKKVIAFALVSSLPSYAMTPGNGYGLPNSDSAYVVPNQWGRLTPETRGPGAGLIPYVLTRDYLYKESGWISIKQYNGYYFDDESEYVSSMDNLLRKCFSVERTRPSELARCLNRIIPDTESHLTTRLASSSEATPLQLLLCQNTYTFAQVIFYEPRKWLEEHNFVWKGSIDSRFENFSQKLRDPRCFGEGIEGPATLPRERQEFIRIDHYELLVDLISALQDSVRFFYPNKPVRIFNGFMHCNSIYEESGWIALEDYGADYFERSGQYLADLDDCIQYYRVHHNLDGFAENNICGAFGCQSIEDYMPVTGLAGLFHNHRDRFVTYLEKGMAKANNLLTAKDKTIDFNNRYFLYPGRNNGYLIWEYDSLKGYLLPEQNTQRRMYRVPYFEYLIAVFNEIHNQIVDPEGNGGK